MCCLHYPGQVFDLGLRSKFERFGCRLCLRNVLSGALLCFCGDAVFHADELTLVWDGTLRRILIAKVELH